jgi:hypothetical protein
MLSANVNAQVVWGATTIATSPPQPNSASAFQVNVSGQVIVGCSPLLLDSVVAQVVGSTIQVMAYISCGVFTTPNQYSFAANVGPLPAGNYTVEHFRRIRGIGSGGPYGTPTIAATLPVLVAFGTPSSAIPTLSGMALVLLASTVLAVGAITIRQRRAAAMLATRLFFIMALVAMLNPCSASAESTKDLADRQLITEINLE